MSSQQRHPARAAKSPEEKRKTQISKKFTSILRHNAAKFKIELDDSGYASVSNILRTNVMRGFKVNEDDVREMVANCPKQRFALLTKDDGKLYIRANQGHTIKIDEDKLLEEIKDASSLKTICHGTYWKPYQSIKTQGLSRMARNHIHFSNGLPTDPSVKSGIRPNCSILIIIDIKKAIQDGFKFYKSANGVILSPGNEEGFLPTKYITHVVNPKKNYALADAESFPNVFELKNNNNDNNNKNDDNDDNNKSSNNDNNNEPPKKQAKKQTNEQEK